MKKKNIISFLVLSSFVLNSCSTGNAKTNNDPEQSAEEPALTTAAYTAPENTEQQDNNSENDEQEPVTAEEYEEEYENIMNDNKIPVCMTGYIPEKFHVYEDLTPYTEPGTGTERPDDYMPAYCYYSGTDVTVRDPELKEITDRFISDSRAELEAEGRKYASFHPDAGEMYTDTDIRIINQYLFVSVYCRLSSDGSVLTQRNGYFNVESKSRISLSDLFFKDVDFMKVINQNIADNYDLKRQFHGINQAMAENICSPFYTSTNLNLEKTILDPYGQINYSLNIYHFFDLLFDSVIYQKPVQFSTSMFTASNYCLDQIYSSEIYFENRPAEYPGFASFPYRSRIMSDDGIMLFNRKVYEDLGDKVYYTDPYHTDIDISSAEVKRGAETQYIHEGRIMEITILATPGDDPLHGTERYYYSIDSMEQLTAREVLEAIWGGDWTVYTDEYVKEHIDDIVIRYIYPLYDIDSYTLNIALYGPDDKIHYAAAEYIKTDDHWEIQK